MISHINIRIFRILVWAQTPSSGQTDFSRAFEGWLHPFVHDTCLVSSLRSICGILRCGSLDGAEYHAGDLVIAWETALFVFVIIGCFKLPLRIALENIWAECQWAPCPKVQVKISGGYISSVVNPECCADCSCATAKHLQDNGVAQQQAGKLQDLMDGRQRSSTAWMIAPFIVGRSGWQFDAICDISAGYASFWTWEWLASRRIVSGWHAASTADMENEWKCLMRLLDMLGTAQLAVFLHLPKW